MRRPLRFPAQRGAARSGAFSIKSLLFIEKQYYFSDRVLPTCQPKAMQRVWDRQFMEWG